MKNFVLLVLIPLTIFPFVSSTERASCSQEYQDCIVNLVPQAVCYAQWLSCIRNEMEGEEN